MIYNQQENLTKNIKTHPITPGAYILPSGFQGEFCAGLNGFLPFFSPLTGDTRKDSG